MLNDDEIALEVFRLMRDRESQQEARSRIGLLADDAMRHVLDELVKSLSTKPSTRNKCATTRLGQDVELLFRGIDSRQPDSNGAFIFSRNALITRLPYGVYRIREERPDRSIVVEKKTGLGWTFIEQEGFRRLSGRRAVRQSMGRGPDASIER